MLGMQLGENTLCVIRKLEEAGYSAYAVGGCVRDLLLGKEPSDIDITTNALPRETSEVFRDFKVIETGIAHGTVTVIVNSQSFEITTFRRDGDYLDSRHPESVTFTSRVEDDLARRDFTVNSMAMDRRGNLIDVFGGKDDLDNKVIRCTGEPDVRFSEDALRIMRALRFSSVLGFEIEKTTAESIHKNKALLSKISVERIFAELKKLLMGRNVFKVLTEYSDVICTVIPELEPSVGFDHMSKYHIYDVYTHIAKTVEAAVPDETVRLVMLLHDVGKPYVCTFDGKYRHFKGHPEVSEKISCDVLRRLHADNETVRLVSLLCRYHDRPIEVSERAVKRLLSKLTYDELRLLCEVRKADSAAHAPQIVDRGREAVEIMKIAEKLEADNACVQIKDLAVNGFDVMSEGFKGPAVGEVLKTLLSEVVEETTANDRDVLLTRIKELALKK